MFVVILCVILLGFLYFYERTVKPKNFPPGPRWNPISGSLATVKEYAKKFGGTHIGTIKLAEEYNTEVLGLKFGSQITIFVCSETTVKEVQRRDEFQARPISFFSRLRSLGTNKGITFTNGEHWNTQRTFLVRHLKNVGFGKLKMDHIIAEELANVLKTLELNETQQIGHMLAPPVLNVLWKLVAGNQFDSDKTYLHNLLNLMSRRSKAFDLSGGWLNSWPWLRFIAPKATGYELITSLNTELRALIISVINEHFKDWYPGRNDDVIHAFITEMKETKDPTFTDDQLVMLCIDIFYGGSQTTSNTLDFVFMCMILHPEVQKKVHAAIDAVYPNGTLPQYKDKHMLPYIEAVICEVQRTYPVAAVTGPRLTLCNTKLGGYDIPKGATILINNYSVNHDASLWKDPENFRPERFLNENNEVVVPDFFYPFNIGKRRCLADALARNCIFTFFTGIMKTYEISLMDKSHKLTGIPIPGITIQPEPYVANFVRRKPICI